MSTEFIKHAFIAGELSRALYGRTDLTKYDLGVALAKNWYVDYRGGLSTRPGTEFCDLMKHDDQTIRLFPFQFSPDLTNSYLVIFGHEYIRFVQDGAYVMESSTRSVSGISSAAPGVVTSNAHGIAAGKWVKFANIVGPSDLNGRSFEVASVTTNTFTLIDPMTGAPVDTTGLPAYVSGGTISVIYEIVSPYQASSLHRLSSFQVRDLLRLTSPLYRIRNLIRNDHDNWTLEMENIGNAITAPTGISLSASNGGDASVAYAVSAIMPDGAESVASFPFRINDIVNFTTEKGSVTITWNPKPGAVQYIIYRTHLVSEGDRVPAGSQMGFLGTTRSTFFVDSNIVPDFTRAPYIHYDPFAQGAIETVTITNGGSGYSHRANVNIAGGTGFSGYAVADPNGVLTSVVIVRRGNGYPPSPTVTITAGGGSGATATATAGATTGVFPSISTVFQQRQVYAATLNQPLTLWGSQIRRYSNFDSSEYVLDSDAYEFEIDSTKVSPLLHMFSMRGGLLVLSQTGVWLLSGGPSQGAVTPTNALAEPQIYTGVSSVTPIHVESDLLYIEGVGSTVRLLAYNDFSKIYSSEDKSILSSHLFGVDRQITRWTYANSPHKLVWGVRSDGALLSFTIVKEQDVFAWTWAQTRGLFKDLAGIQENGVDRVYMLVERYVNGHTRRFLERLATRSFTHTEDAWTVDAGLRLEPRIVNTRLQISTEFIEGGDPFVTMSANAPPGGLAVDCWVRGAGGIFVVTELFSPTEWKARVVRSATRLLPEDEDKSVLEVMNFQWTLGTPVTTIGGLWHLEGEEVAILGDGSVFPRQTVTNGRVTLPDAVSKATIGLPYSCVMQTLPPTSPEVPIESRRKRVVGIGVRLDEARGLEIGNQLDRLYELKERTNEAYGTPTFMQNGMRYMLLATEWDEDGQTYFVQNQPLPATILGLVPDLEIGDDTD